MFWPVSPVARNGYSVLNYLYYLHILTYTIPIVAIFRVDGFSLRHLQFFHILRWCFSFNNNNNNNNNEKILQTANCMINCHLGFLISIKTGLAL